MNELSTDDLQMISFQIIMNSGDGRSDIHEAFSFMREGDFDEAEEKLKEANDKIVKAHNSQTDLLHGLANGQKMNIDVLLIHAQDHLMTTMTLREAATEMLFLHRKTNA